MIIWINGPFGSGKTVVAHALRPLLARSGYFDPEQIGYLVRSFMHAPTEDFQDIPIWRRMVVETAHGLATTGPTPLLTPMSVLDAGYRAEIFGPLRRRGVRVAQVVLEVPELVLRSRIKSDYEQPWHTRTWRLKQLDRAIAALAGLDEIEEDTVIVQNGPGKSPRRVAIEIAWRLDLPIIPAGFD